MAKAVAHVGNDHQDNWDNLLPYTLSTYHTSIHKATGNTPFYLLYSHNPYLPVNITSHTVKSRSDTTPKQHKSELVDQLHDTHTYRKMAKLAQMWKGPYCVSEARGQLVLALQHINNPWDQQVVSVQHIKPCQLNESLADFTQWL
jgi:hypothetical protein